MQILNTTFLLANMSIGQIGPTKFHLYTIPINHLNTLCNYFNMCQIQRKRQRREAVWKRLERQGENVREEGWKEEESLGEFWNFLEI